MILTDEELLRKPCSACLLTEAKEIILSLEKELELSNNSGNPGIGLAAPQIGIYKNVAIIRLNDSINDYKINLVNPRIVNKYDQTVFMGEGCLSFPGRFEKTIRYQEIQIENDVFPFKFIAKGLLAVVIQHEMDHLIGKLLPDNKVK